MKKNINMTEKQIIDRLDSINLSLRQKKDLIDIIKDITANSGGGGGGTSTDKDTLTILVDRDTQTVTVNDKQFLISSDSEGVIRINNKELYNFLFNINIPVFIKAFSNDLQIAGYATCMSNDTLIILQIFTIDGAFAIIVNNE